MYLLILEFVNTTVSIFKSCYAYRWVYAVCPECAGCLRVLGLKLPEGQRHMCVPLAAPEVAHVGTVFE